MAQIAKVETSVQTKCSADKVYHLMARNMGKLADLTPKHFQSVEELEGEEGCVGNVKLLKFNLGGPKTCTLRFLSVDDGKKSLTFEVIGGDIMQSYKSFKTTVSAVDGNTVKWSMEFEKADESVPAPDHYIVMATQVTKLLDAHFAN